MATATNTATAPITERRTFTDSATAQFHGRVTHVQELQSKSGTRFVRVEVASTLSDTVECRVNVLCFDRALYQLDQGNLFPGREVTVSGTISGLGSHYVNQAGQTKLHKFPVVNLKNANILLQSFNRDNREKNLAKIERFAA